MSLQAVRAVRQCGARGNDRLVLYELAERANSETGEAFPSVDTLAADAGLSRRTVQRSLRSLETDGYIEARGGGQGGRARTTRYLVLGGKGATQSPNGSSERASAAPETASPATGKRVTETPEPGTNQKRTRRNGYAPAGGQEHFPNASAYAGPSACRACGAIRELTSQHCEDCYPAFMERLTGERP